MNKFMLELKAITGNKLAAPPESTSLLALAVCFLKWGRYLPTPQGIQRFPPQEQSSCSRFLVATVL